MQLTLSQLFGEGATQTTDSLIIQKSYLKLLTPTPNNHAEQLLAAIVLTTHSNFAGVLEDEFNRTVTNDVGESIEFENSFLYDQLALTQWKTFVVNSKIKHTFLINQLQVYAN
jgi:hypothetical protein